MEQPPAVTDVERRKQVKIRIRTDLAINPQKYEGKTYYVVKDPVSLRYYRFEEQEHFIINMIMGKTLWTSRRRNSRSVFVRNA